LIPICKCVLNEGFDDSSNSPPILNEPLDEPIIEALDELVAEPFDEPLNELSLLPAAQVLPPLPAQLLPPLHAGGCRSHDRRRHAVTPRVQGGRSAGSLSTRQRSQNGSRSVSPQNSRSSGGRRSPNSGRGSSSEARIDRRRRDWTPVSALTHHTYSTANAYNARRRDGHVYTTGRYRTRDWNVRRVLAGATADAVPRAVEWIHPSTGEVVIHTLETRQHRGGARRVVLTTDIRSAYEWDAVVDIIRAGSDPTLRYPSVAEREGEWQALPFEGPAGPVIEGSDAVDVVYHTIVNVDGLGALWLAQRRS